MMLGATLGLAACASNPAPPPPPQVATTAIRPTAPPAVAEQLISGPDEAATAEMIWALRGGLNVAALQCGNRSLSDNYNKILKQHRSILNEAYAAEQARYGKQYGKAGIARHDVAMTRLYNRFANLPNRARYCGDAARLSAELLALPSDRLPGVARRALARLDPAAPPIVNAAR
ncbi:hypothetical protein [Sandarakinorhabdus rubra]|uniref:hypothetical protein n=1 Tax=Sandarakinorhabdus rubra TaxID=2672568 RepID=UPI0013D9E744|nr:hypothetical protein [Sandarakinorhabdus rubra]